MEEDIEMEHDYRKALKLLGAHMGQVDLRSEIRVPQRRGGARGAAQDRPASARVARRQRLRRALSLSSAQIAAAFPLVAPMPPVSTSFANVLWRRVVYIYSRCAAAPGRDRTGARDRRRDGLQQQDGGGRRVEIAQPQP